MNLLEQITFIDWENFAVAAGGLLIAEVSPANIGVRDTQTGQEIPEVCWADIRKQVLNRLDLDEKGNMQFVGENSEIKKVTESRSFELFLR